MTERKPPRDPLMPPPLPPRLDTVRPGIDRPEDRPRIAGRPATPPAAGLPVRPPYDPDRPPVGRTSRSQPASKGSGWILTLGLTIFTVLVVAGAGAAYLVLAPPVELIRQQAIAQVKAKTGRDLTIAGATSFNVWPELKLTMRDVALSAPAGMGGAPLVTVAELDASVKLWPLLQRQIKIDQLVLRQPVFDLRVDTAGKRSWDFADAAGPPPLVQYAQAAPAQPVPGKAAAGVPDAVKDFVENASDPDNPSPQMKAKLARLEELTLGDVRIEGGSLLYSDARTGASRQVTALDTRVSLKSLASPLDATGKLDFDGQSVGFDVKLASPKAILEDRPAKLALTLKAAPLDAKFDGTVTTRSTVDLEGDVSAKGASLRALLRWLGHELPPADGFGPVALAGKLKTTGTNYALTDANLGLDGSTASGLMQLETSGARPRVTANLKISELNLNRYTLAAGTAVVHPKAAVIRAAGAQAVPAPAAKSIEDLINGVSGPQVKGYTKRAGWSEDAIPLGALAEADVDAKLSIGKLLYREIQVGQSTVMVALKSKALRLSFDDVALYEGHGRGFLTIDANPAVAVASANLSLDGVAAKGLLKDVADFDWLAGTAKMTVAVSAQGASETALVQTANGKADFSFANGSIVGFNLPGIIRGLMQGKFTGLSTSPAEKTDFSEMTASFQIANGVATNQDLKLVSPLLRVSGTGQIALPPQTLDYTVRPKIVGSLQGQGATDALSGLEIPVRITGPWAKPQFTPDAGGILKDPSKAIEAAKALGRQLKDSGTAKQATDALKGLLNKGSADGQGSIDTSKAKDLLNKLFKARPQSAPVPVQPQPQPQAAPPPQ